MESTEETPLSKISPFKIEKTLKPKYIKKLYNGNLLIETHNEKQTKELLKLKTFENIKIKSYLHPTLNTCRGVVKSQELSLCTLEEIKTNLQEQDVLDVRRIQIKKNNETINTNTYILTFDSHTPPKEVKAGYIKLNVEPYIPNPLRCHNCQKFGHHKDRCTHSPICERCGENGTHINCEKDPKCANCQQNHWANSKNCSIWQKEKEIIKTKHTKNISFPEARKLIENSNYADITKKNIPNINQTRCHTCEANSSNLKLEDISLLINEMKNLLNEIKNSLIKTTSQNERQSKKNKNTTESMSQTKSQNLTTTKEVKPMKPLESPQNTKHEEKGKKIPPDKNESGHSPRRDRSLSTPRSGSRPKTKTTIPTQNRYEAMESSDG